jgi:hypothetical protein
MFRQPNWDTPSDKNLMKRILQRSNWGKFSDENFQTGAIFAKRSPPAERKKQAITQRTVNGKSMISVKRTKLIKSSSCNAFSKISDPQIHS